MAEKFVISLSLEQVQALGIQLGREISTAKEAKRAVVEKLNLPQDSKRGNPQFKKKT